MQTTITRRFGAGILALGVALALAACSPTGPDANGGDTSTAPAATAAATPTGTVDAASECATVTETLTTVGTRIEGLQAKIPGDIPGAIADVQTSIDDLTTLSGSLQEGELKTHVDNVIRLGGEVLTMLEQTQAGDKTTLELIADGATKLSEVQAELAAINDYCAAA